MILLQSKSRNYTFNTYSENPETKLVVINDNLKDIEVETLLRLEEIVRIEFLDINNEYIKKFNIDKLPTYIFIKNGNETRLNHLVYHEVKKLNEL